MTIINHVSSLPSFCYIKCEESGGKVSQKQSDHVFVQSFARLCCAVPGTVVLLWFRAPWANSVTEGIAVTLWRMMPALFWMDTIIRSIALQSFSTRILAIDYFSQYFQRNEVMKCTVCFSLQWSFWCSICNGNERITYSCVQIRKMTNINNPCSIHL